MKTYYQFINEKYDPDPGKRASRNWTLHHKAITWYNNRRSNAHDYTVINHFHKNTDGGDTSVHNLFNAIHYNPKKHKEIVNHPKLPSDIRDYLIGKNDTPGEKRRRENEGRTMYHPRNTNDNLPMDVEHISVRARGFNRAIGTTYKIKGKYGAYHTDSDTKWSNINSRSQAEQTLRQHHKNWKNNF